MKWVSGYGRACELAHVTVPRPEQQNTRSEHYNVGGGGCVNDIEAFPGWSLAVESKGVQISEYTLLREWAIRGSATWTKQIKGCKGLVHCHIHLLDKNK